MFNRSFELCSQFVSLSVPDQLTAVLNTYGFLVSPNTIQKVFEVCQFGFYPFSWIDLMHPEIWMKFKVEVLPEPVSCLVLSCTNQLNGLRFLVSGSKDQKYTWFSRSTLLVLTMLQKINKIMLVYCGMECLLISIIINFNNSACFLGLKLNIIKTNLFFTSLDSRPSLLRYMHALWWKEVTVTHFAPRHILSYTGSTALNLLSIHPAHISVNRKTLLLLKDGKTSLTICIPQNCSGHLR